MARLLSICLVLAGTVSLSALPPMPSVGERFQQADVVVLARISEVQTRDFSEASRAASMLVEVEESFKGQTPRVFHLYFLVFPFAYDRHLREPLPPGRYFLYLSKNSSGALLPLEPRPFAFLEFSDDRLAEIRSLAGR